MKLMRWMLINPPYEWLIYQTKIRYQFSQNTCSYRIRFMCTDYGTLLSVSSGPLIYLSMNDHRFLVQVYICSFLTKIFGGVS